MILFSNIPYRWRYLIGFAIFSLVVLQSWFITHPQHPPNHNELSVPTTPPTPSTGFASKLPTIQHPNVMTEPDPRREAIVDGFKHAWSGYKEYAWMHDELKPVSKSFKDPFGGWGASLVDGLSTLLVMGLEDEFREALPELEKIEFHAYDGTVSVFESIIRYMGGLLSAYELSNEQYPILLQKADELGQVLLPAFDTPTGLPTHEWNPVKGKAPSNTTLIAEVGTVQLEFFTLSRHTGKKIYAEKAQAIVNFLEDAGYEHGIYVPGLYPSGMQTSKGRFTDTTCSFGAMGDSAFEYFLKEHILTDGAMPQYARLYTQSIDSMKRYMLRQLPGTKFLFLPPYDTRTDTPKKYMDHLTCFAPGMLAMGAKVLDRPEDMTIAKGLLEMCVYMYRSSSTGLCPETWIADDTEPYNPLTYTLSRDEISNAHDWWYNANANAPPARSVQPLGASTGEPPSLLSSKLPSAPQPRPNGLRVGDKRYLLRPETLESLYMLYRITGDPIYQEYGWEIFQAIEQYCKTEAAYASIVNVEMARRGTNQLDSMESFLFAETFKYLYLLFSPGNVISLDEYVFNTEAHPLIRRTWI
ncbi:hypothetical protein LRAMOSA05271 [Lichtheimia ramosa]|uniref:alpha-1,2-Mannosidase n=1 Tax=Lichtheimia ramosa TaxID=688394 RepID=A0A077X236_9FUNG|nr:hypothetical protein LRAMOSA05271 [Lichtheimia ramosa]